MGGSAAAEKLAVCIVPPPRRALEHFARRENLLTAAGRFLLSNQEAAKIIDRMVEIVREEWDCALRRAGVSKKDCGAIASARVYEGFFYSSDGQRDSKTS